MPVRFLHGDDERNLRRGQNICNIIHVFLEYVGPVSNERIRFGSGFFQRMNRPSLGGHAVELGKDIRSHTHGRAVWPGGIGEFFYRIPQRLGVCLAVFAGIGHGRKAVGIINHRLHEGNPFGKSVGKCLFRLHQLGFIRQHIPRSQFVKFRPDNVLAPDHRLPEVRSGIGERFKIGGLAAR